MISRNQLRFGADGTFTIMQVSDIQDINGLAPRTKELFVAALEREQPDFVVFTGDQLKGYGLELLFANEAQREQRIMRTINALAGPLAARDIPFTITFGNHDHDAPMDPLTQVNRWQLWPNCLTEHIEGMPGYANHAIPVLGSQAEAGASPALLLYFLDTHKSTGWRYMPLAPEQIDWYRETRDEYAARNNNQCVPSMLFQHVPIEELYELYKIVPAKTPGSFEGFHNHKGAHYALDMDKVAPGAFMGELPSSPDENTGLFGAALEKGEMLGMFFGHDHNNGYHGDVRGIQLGYAPAAGYAAYGPGRKRGVRMIRLNENHLAGFESYVLTDEQLLGDSKLGLRIKLADTQPPSWGEVGHRVRRLLPRLALVSGGIALGLAALEIAKRAARTGK